MKNKSLFSIAAILLLVIFGCKTLSVDELELMDRGPGWNNDEFVSLDSGYIQGREDLEDTFSWKGIPYAAPPVGELRWKAPRPAEPWDDVMRAFNFGGKAIQFMPLFSDTLTGTEDCLYLNVWRPSTTEKGLPVYVWIHGGGNSVGSSDPRDYWGHAVAARSNAVFVSMNYRLGPFGWFRHPSLMSDNKLDNSGNYGLLDIVAALEWIQRNIEAFGGNPGNVTLSGESAGANNTLSLMLSPRAEGLFHKAIIQSGYKSSVSPAAAERQASELADYLLKKKDFNSVSLSLRAMKEILMQSSAEDIMRFYKPGSTGMINHLYHIEDGLVFPEDGYQPLEKGEQANPVPVIIGSNKDETKIFLFFDSSPSHNSELYEPAAMLGSVNFRQNGVDEVAGALSGAANSPPVYGYRFDWGTLDEEGESPLPGTYGKRLGAFHTLEIPFFLGTESINGPFLTALLFNRRNKDSRGLLTEAVMTYTRNFIHNGNPNTGEDVPLIWPKWDESHRYLVLDADEEQLDITIDDAVVTRQEALFKLKKELNPDVYEQVLKYINWR